jgi:predicted DsbA family dithiol-disulfide isomerase
MHLNHYLFIRIAVNNSGHLLIPILYLNLQYMRYIYAYETALAAEAAAAQGKFWEMYDYLFKHGQWVTSDNLRQSAAKLGLGLAGFDRDFLDRRYSRE